MGYVGRPSTIGDVLLGHAARDPGAVAIVCPDLGTLTFAELARHVGRIGEQLRLAGIVPTSRVGIALPRGPEAALLSIAVCCSAILLPINPNLAPAELKAELGRLRLHALIVPAGAEPAGWVAAGGEDFGLFTAAQALSSFEEVALEQVRPVRRSLPASIVTAQSWAVIFRTSGTTGVPKRVPVTHGNLIEMARKMERWLTLGPADRAACILPIYYNAGFKATLVVPLLIGCGVALPATTNPQDFERWMAELKPTWLTAAPTFLQAVVEKLRASTEAKRPSSLRFVLSTASYLPEATRAELARLLAVPVVEFYGLCEAGMMTAPALAPDQAPKGSVGRVPGSELAIRSESGTFLRPGETGEVMLRGPSVMPGYLLDDIEGTPTGLLDGWLPTGDLGTVDKNGFLTIVGRSKEIINRGGEKIAPYEVEKALLAHPAVRDAACFAVPHPRLGENVGAAVVLHAGADATSRELIDFLHDRLAPFQMPRQVHVVQSLPVGATGKISRPQLSATFAGRQRQGVLPEAPLEILIDEIWQRLLGRGDIGMDDDFFEIGGDSLQATEMLLELEDITRYRIAPSEVRAQLTIRQLSESLAGAAAAKHEVMTRVKAGKGMPLFLCHGDFCGWGFYGFRLAELLKGSGPVYLLHSMLNAAEGVETIEEMVRRYLPHIEAAAPTGPLRLAGYCHGGLAALEIARHLEAQGRSVDKVVLIDSFSINARPVMRGLAHMVSIAGRLAPGAWGRKFRRSAMPSLWVFASHFLQGDLALLRRARRTVAKGAMRIWDDSQRTTYYRAMSKYLPPRLSCEVICLLSEEYAARKAYDPAAWKHLAARVRTDHIPGEHNTCVSRHVGDLAERLNQMLAA
jgi:acyl-CoA synthetase (AMP-forming)/AMP-acid ligase II/thioesterase domain-containing protein/acyl carrier protein